MASDFSALAASLPGVEIVGVTKGQSLERIQQLVAGGLVHLGNNYVQPGESLRKHWADLPALRWHFIGHIQSRKVKELLGYDCIQSLDRWSVAEELDRRLQPLHRKLEVLVQVNVGNEESKSGIAVSEVESFFAQLSQLSRLVPRGLMALPPPLEPVERRRSYFAQLKELYDRLAGQHDFRWLSMGTSDDYAIAVEEGASMVRLGTALFGPRQ